MKKEPGMPAERAVRLAMWSGPRNISTAMMRAFGNRPDCAVIDEPFYGYYLKTSGSDHPGREQIIAAMDCDWRSVARSLTEGPAPAPLFYQKHMTHHMLAEVDLAFTGSLINCFLVREPARMIASYARVRPDFGLEDLGLPQQLRIFRYVEQRTGRRPLVVDAAEVLANPRAALERLCRYAGIEFDDRMLSWPAGPRLSDGVWAPYWYAAVEASTGFEPLPAGPPQVPAGYQGLADAARRLYEALCAD
jgi:Sulfotransferase domain